MIFMVLITLLDVCQIRSFYRIEKLDSDTTQQQVKWEKKLPSSRSLTSLAARSPSALKSLSIFLDLSAASFSPVVLTAHPIFSKMCQPTRFLYISRLMTLVALGRGNRPLLKRPFLSQLLYSQLYCIPNTNCT